MTDVPFAFAYMAPPTITSKKSRTLRSAIIRPTTAGGSDNVPPRPKTASSSTSHHSSRTNKSSYSPTVAYPPPAGAAVMPSRNDSNASSTTSPVDSATGGSSSGGGLWKSHSSLSIRKQRSASITATTAPINLPSPKKLRQNRLSRSLSSDVEDNLGSLRSQEHKGKTVQKRSPEPVASPSKGRPPGLRMLSNTFSHKSSDYRRPTDPSPRDLGGMASGHQQQGYSPLATFNHIHDTTNKRMATLDYLRKVHEGQVYYFSTISYNQSFISAIPSLHPARLGRRATNYFLLGSSITPLLEFYASNPLDYLKSLAALLAEFDTYCQYSSSEHGSGSFGKNRMGAMFKRGVKPKRSATADSAFSEHGSANGSSSNLSSIADSMPLPPASHVSHDFQYLQTPSLPFDPDFGTSFGTLIEILMEAYAGLLTLLNTPESCAPGLAEVFAKADKQLRKVMLDGIISEFGDSTRVQAKSEVGGLGRLVLSGLM